MHRFLHFSIAVSLHEQILNFFTLAREQFEFSWHTHGSRYNSVGFYSFSLCLSPKLLYPSRALSHLWKKSLSLRAFIPSEMLKVAKSELSTARDILYCSREENKKSQCKTSTLHSVFANGLDLPVRGPYLSPLSTILFFIRLPLPLSHSPFLQHSRTQSVLCYFVVRMELSDWLFSRRTHDVWKSLHCAIQASVVERCEFLCRNCYSGLHCSTDCTLQSLRVCRRGDKKRQRREKQQRNWFTNGIT